MGLKAVRKELEQSITGNDKTHDSTPSVEKKPGRKPAPKLSKEEIDSLIVENREDGEKMAWKLLGSLRIRLAKDDVKSIVGIALCEAAIRFDPSYETSFKTFFYYHLRGILLKEITEMINSRKVLNVSGRRRNAKGIEYYNEYYLDQVSNLSVDRKTPEKILQSKQISELCEEACSYLDDLEREVITRYFLHDESLVQIADELGYCRCHLSRVKNSALKRLGQMLEPVASTPRGKVEAILRRDGALRLHAPDRSRYTGGRGRRKRTKASRKQARKAA